MSTNIGNLAVTLALDAVAFSQGLDKSSKGMKEFADGAAKSMAAVSAIAATAGTAGDVASRAFEWVRKGIDDVADVGKEAQRFGISTEKLSAIQFAAGRQADAWEQGLRHLNVALGEGNPELDRYGLSAQELASMGLDRAIDKIADKFKEINSSTDKAALAQKLFGREAAVLIPLLQRGSAGLAEADAAAKKLGMSVSAIDATKAIMAQRAMDEVGHAFEGIQRTAAVEFAPVLTGIAETAKDMIAQLGGGKAIFREIADQLPGAITTGLKGAEGIAVALADAADSVKRIADTVDGAGFQKWLAAKGGGFGVAAGSAFGFVTSGGVPTTGTGAAIKAQIDPWIKELDQNMRDFAARAQAHAADLGGLGRGGVKDAAADADKLGDAVKKLSDKLRDEVEAFGKGADAVERMKLAHDGATAAQLAGIDASIAQLQALKDQEDATKRMGDLAGRITSSLGTTEAVHHAGAALEGSTAAYSTILHAQDQGRGGDTQQQIAAATQRVLKEEEKQTRLHQQVLDALNRIFKKG